MTDGYQVYHTLEKEKEDLRIADCWVHCRRKFHEALEVMPKELRKQSVMHLIMNQIQAIYREEGKLSGLSLAEGKAVLYCGGVRPQRNLHHYDDVLYGVSCGRCFPGMKNAGVTASTIILAGRIFDAATIRLWV